MSKCLHCKQEFTGRRTDALYCSNKCKTFEDRAKKGISAPAFLKESKPITATNQERNLLTEQVKNEHRTLTLEIDNLEQVREQLELKYKKLHSVLKNYELYDKLPPQYIIKTRTKAEPKPTPPPPFSENFDGDDGEELIMMYQSDPVKFIRTPKEERSKWSFMEMVLGSICDKYKLDAEEYEEQLSIWKENELARKDKSRRIESSVIKIEEDFYECKEKLEGIKEELRVKKDYIKSNYARAKAELQAKEAEEQTNSRRKRVTAAQVIGMSFDCYDFTDKWEKLIGKPSKPFFIMIYGDPKVGKSYFTMEFAEYTTAFCNPNEVAYFVVEEGISLTTQQKLAAVGAKKICLECAHDLEEMVNILDQENYKFVFIDSVNAMKLEEEDMKNLRDKFPKTSFVAILQSNKQGGFAGSQTWSHDVGAIIEVVKGDEERTTMISCTGRYGGTGNLTVAW